MCGSGPSRSATRLPWPQTGLCLGRGSEAHGRVSRRRQVVGLTNSSDQRAGNCCAFVRIAVAVHAGGIGGGATRAAVRTDRAPRKPGRVVRQVGVAIRTDAGRDRARESQCYAPRSTGEGASRRRAARLRLLRAREGRVSRLSGSTWRVRLLLRAGLPGVQRRNARHRLNALRARGRATRTRPPVLVLLLLRRLEQPARGRLGDDPDHLQRGDRRGGARGGAGPRQLLTTAAPGLVGAMAAPVVAAFLLLATKAPPSLVNLIRSLVYLAVPPLAASAFSQRYCRL